MFFFCTTICCIAAPRAISIAISYSFGTVSSSATAPSIPCNLFSLAFNTSRTLDRNQSSPLASLLAFLFENVPVVQIDMLDTVLFRFHYTAPCISQVPLLSFVYSKGFQLLFFYLFITFHKFCLFRCNFHTHFYIFRIFFIKAFIFEFCCLDCSSIIDNSLR